MKNLPRQPGNTAFTLLEMLVSMAILSILVVMLFDMINSASQALGSSQKLLNVDDEARQVFGRMASDFAGILNRNDVDVLFSRETPGNDKLFFYSSAIGSNPYLSTSGNSPVSLVGYCMGPDAQRTVINANLSPTYLQDLLRLGRGLCWDPTTGTDNMVYLTFTAGQPGPNPASTLDGHWSAASSSKTIGPVSPSAFSTDSYLPPPGNANTPPTDPDYHVLGNQVIRFEYCFLLKDGTYSNYPAENYTANGNAAYKSNLDPSTISPPGPRDDSTAGYAVNSRWFDCSAGRAYICTDATAGAAVWSGLGFNDISAIVVAIALVDRDSRKLVTTAAGWSSLPTKLLDPSDGDLGQTPPKLMQQTWEAALNSLVSSGMSGMPVTVLAHTHVYQRYFYLNTSTAL